jgi:FtsP/CotA-like multicopper oxidase with cupredoxin domain
MGLAMALHLASPAASFAEPAGAEAVRANDNTRSAGTADAGLVSVRLRAASGAWRPEGSHGPALTVEAFGEEGSALMVPAPLVRVREGAMLAMSIRNDLTSPLRVHGLCTRDGSPCAPVDVPPGERRDLRLAAGRAGTYHYWATTMQAPVPFRELAGAFIVDAPGAIPRDRVLVITEWTSLTPQQLRAVVTADVPGEAFLAARPRVAFVINGLSWPATEQLTYRHGETVRWRVINLSSQAHPMHLHGFYFTVLRTGDGRRDDPVAGGEGRRVVTHLLPTAGTMLMAWTPEREGNWLFHCHVMHHVSPERRLETHPHAGAGHGSQPSGHSAGQPDPSLGMAGLVLGIKVLPDDNARRPTPPPSSTPPRRLTMVISRAGGVTSGMATAAIQISEGDTPTPHTAAVSPGPVLVLRRGEPVEITVANRLPDATSVHWHGLEIESYYDGVHGWSGAAGKVAPMIEPGHSFVVRITPPRAGTFIYHTHLHDYRQLSSGLYGPIVVTEPGDVYDPAVDHVLVLGRRNASEASGILEDADSAVINGEPEPRWVWGAGRRHRVRLINITPDDVLNVALVARNAPATWRPLTKDGAPVPPAEGQEVPAQVRIAVGETYDFEYVASPGPGTLWAEVRSASGKWQTQGRVVLK